jgi:hypothetical protein
MRLLELRPCEDSLQMRLRIEFNYANQIFWQNSPNQYYFPGPGDSPARSLHK